jgi:thymidylate synthase
MVAHLTGLEAHEFIHTIGDAHIYLDHVEQTKEQLTREPQRLPDLLINKEITKIDDYWFDDFKVFGYNPHSAIKGNVSV